MPFVHHVSIIDGSPLCTATAMSLEQSSVVNNRPNTVACLFHSTSSTAYRLHNAIGVMQRVAWIRLRQLKVTVSPVVV